MSRGADTKANTFGGGGALERGDGAPLEPLAQLGDAHGGVGTPDFAILILVEAAELVAAQPVKVGVAVSTGADTKANTLGAAAHLRLVIFVSLRMAASVETPSAPMPLSTKLCESEGQDGKW